MEEPPPPTVADPTPMATDPTPTAVEPAVIGPTAPPAAGGAAANPAAAEQGLYWELLEEGTTAPECMRVGAPGGEEAGARW